MRTSASGPPDHLLAWPRTAAEGRLEPTDCREANGRNRGEGHEPWPICDIPDGRGRGAATDVRRHAVADRPAPGTARAGMTGAAVRCDHGTMVEVRLDAGKAPRFGGAARSTGDFNGLPDTQHAICHCSRRPRDRSFPRDEPESGECRFTIAQTRRRGDRGPEIAGNPGDFGSLLSRHCDDAEITFLAVCSCPRDFPG